MPYISDYTIGFAPLLFISYIRTCFSSVAANVSFEQPTYTVNETDENVELVLVLSNPSAAVITVEVLSTDGSATDGSATDGSATDGSATDGSATDGSATDGSATDGSATGEQQLSCVATLQMIRTYNRRGL